MSILGPRRPAKAGEAPPALSQCQKSSSRRTHRLFETQRAFPPLPAGEGRGEGERLASFTHLFQKLLFAIVLILLFVLSTPSHANTNQSLVLSGLKWEPVSAYHEQKILGWRVLVNQKLVAETNLCARTLKLLQTQLAQITNVIPAQPLQTLRDIPIWLERTSKETKCAAYHQSAAWLREHDVNPEKVGAVEIGSPENFLSWTKQQPWMVLHELAHGYHARFLGNNNPRIQKCFETAKAGKKYESVQHINGQSQRHYALNNDKEYFAEATEAFFGKNDFQPFTRSELKDFDPEMHALLFSLWNVPESPK